MGQRDEKNGQLFGDVYHDICGDRWRFRPSFEAIMAIEAELGPVVPLAQRVGAGEFGLRDVTIILGATTGRTREEMGAIVLRHGLADLAGPVREILMQILTGTSSGKSGPPVG